MIHGVIDGQNLRVDYDPVVADSQNYLFAKFRFESPEWRDEIVKVAHFSKDGVTYDFVLDENDEITADRGVNLTEGVWTVYIHGNRTVDGEIMQRIPTNGAELIVKNSPIPAEGVFPVIPVSIVEQILAKIGDTTDLKTIDRRSLVHAINELYYTLAPMVESVDTLLGKIDHKMEYAILEFDGTAFNLDGQPLTFQQIKTLCLDNVHFVYAQYENRLYIPQYVSGSNIFFDASYIQSDIPKMNRISISSSGAVSQFSFELVKSTELISERNRAIAAEQRLEDMIRNLNS